MLLYGDINLHAINSVIVLLNDLDQVIYPTRLPNLPPMILKPLSLHYGEIMVLSWYEFVDSSCQNAQKGFAGGRVGWSF
jgi:hypothetical protein